MVEPNSLPPKELSFLKELIPAYPKHTGAMPSSWGLFSYDYKHATHSILTSCHAHMQYEDAGVYDTLITAVPKSDELSLAYCRFLVNGPFRGYSDKITLESIKLNDKVDYYFRVTDLDQWPANVLYNFCIATRTPVEHKGCLKNWDLLVKAGVDETMAFLIAVGNQNVIKVPADILSWKLSDASAYNNHFWYDSSSNWLNILNGAFDPKRVKGNYKDTPGASRPTNCIWGSGQPREFIGMTVLELSQKLDRPIYVPPVKKVPRVKKVQIEELGVVEVGLQPLDVVGIIHDEVQFWDDGGPVPEPMAVEHVEPLVLAPGVNGGWHIDHVQPHVDFHFDDHIPDDPDEDNEVDDFEEDADEVGDW